jgi:hypothetical protein
MGASYITCRPDTLYGPGKTLNFMDENLEFISFFCNLPSEMPCVPVERLVSVLTQQDKTEGETFYPVYMYKKYIFVEFIFFFFTIPLHLCNICLFQGHICGKRTKGICQ